MYAGTEAGYIITAYNSFDASRQARLLGYVQALQAMEEGSD